MKFASAVSVFLILLVHSQQSSASMSLNALVKEVKSKAPGKLVQIFPSGSSAVSVAALNDRPLVCATNYTVTVANEICDFDKLWTTGGESIFCRVKGP